MERRQFLKNLAAGSAVLAAGLPRLSAAAEQSGAASATESNKPNFIFILADDMGWGDLACFGHPWIKTPRLDQLAREGTRFTQFYCNAAICSPTRAGIMTGLFPGRVGMHAQISTREQMKALDSTFCLDPKYPMLPRLMRERGYRTMHIGKWHLSGWLHENPELPRPDQYGFDEYLEPYLNWPATKYGDKWQDATHRPYTTELFVDEAIAFVERAQAKPFYLHLWLTDPHEPTDPAPEQMHYYDTKDLKAPYDKEPKKEPHQLYWNIVSEMDRQLGRLFDKVDALGLGKNTYIVFCSDNGAALSLSYPLNVGMGSNGPFRGEKGSLYEGGTRTPFILRRPGTVTAGKVDNETVLSGVDFMPTCCALAGKPIDKNQPHDGDDLSAAFLGHSASRKNPLMWEWRFRQPWSALHRSPMLARREGNWKLLMNPDRSRVELYDIPNDPMEVDNRAAEHADIVERMATPLLAYHKSLPPGILDPQAGGNAYPWPK